MPWEKRGDGFAIDAACLGTAFFVNGAGIFVSAAHLFESNDAQPPRRSIMLLLRRSYVPAPVLDVQVNADCDIAIGLVRLPRGAPPLPVLRIGSTVLKVGETVACYGFSRTEVKEFPDRSGSGTSIAFNLQPRYYAGVIDAHHPAGFGLAKWPCYRHTVDEPGGLSGAPMVRLEDSAAYGIFSSSMQGAYGVSADLVCVLDRRIDFLHGRTLRSLATLVP